MKLKAIHEAYKNRVAAVDIDRRIRQGPSIVGATANHMIGAAFAIHRISAVAANQGIVAALLQLELTSMGLQLGRPSMLLELQLPTIEFSLFVWMTLK